MKKIIFLTLCLAAVDANAKDFFVVSHAPFAGPYAGVDLGYRSVALKDSQSSQIFVPATFTITLGSTPESMVNNLIGGVDLGYGIRFNNMLLGLEGKAIFANNKPNSITNKLSEVNSQLLINTNATVTLKNEYSLLFKFGYLPTPTTLMYGVLGPQWGYFQSYTSTDYMQNLGIDIVGSTQNSHSQYNAGFALGVGVEQLLTDKLSLAFEFTHVNYHDIDYPTTSASSISIGGIPVPGSALTETHTLSSQTNNLLFKVNYYFA